MKELSISTAAGALIMALGILINGAAQQILFLQTQASPFLAAVLLVLLAAAAAGYAHDARDGVMYEKHLRDPILSFAAGTWVAGLSVTAAVIANVLPQLRMLVLLLYIAASLLWMGYILLIVRNCLQILQDPDLLNKANGVVLLGCVSTQSIVVAGNSLFGLHFPSGISRILIIAGLGLYAAGMLLIAARYRKVAGIDLAKDWNNTNCIIHGALSITGLASSTTSVFSADFIAAVWVLVLGLFLAVELLEIMRAVQRIRIFGWKKGIFVYSPTQWSRNFTFGMLVAFSVKVPLHKSFLAGNTLCSTLQQSIISAGSVVVIILFLLETALLLQTLIGRTEKAVI